MVIGRQTGKYAGLGLALVAAWVLTASPGAAQTQTGDAFMDTMGLTKSDSTKPGAANTAIVSNVKSIKGDTTYLLSAFPAASQNQLSMFSSYDGITFTSLAGETYTPPKGLLRDPSILHAGDGFYYIVYTTGWAGQSFGIAKSRDLKNWTHVRDVPLDMPGLTNVWAPEWFRDTDGQVYVVVSLSKGGIPGPFGAYLLKATDATLTAFSAPQIMQGLENNHIDTFPIKVGDTYVVFTKNETNKTIELATAKSLTGPWTIEKTGNWAGWGDWIEGPAVVAVTDADGKQGWRIYFDDYLTKHYWYSDSFDGLKTWTPRKELGGVSGAVRHFTVIKEPTKVVEAATAPKGKPVRVTWDKHSLMLDDKRVMIWSGEFHPFRLPSPSLWRDILQKMKATGYNSVSLYFDWGYHSPKEGAYDFSGIRNMERVIEMAEEEGMYIIIRPGPYVNAELTMGGFPGWLARQKAFARTDDPEYLKAVDEWQTQIDTIVARHQITNGGGNVILFQIENELSDTSDTHKRYMQHLADKVHADGITVPIFHNSAGRLPNWTPPSSTASFAVSGPTDLYSFDGYPGGSCTDTAEVGKPNVVPNWGIWGEPKPDAKGVVKVGALASPNTPGFAAEIGGGWFDYWGSVGTYECTSKRIGSEYERVFFGSSLANGLSIHSIYTAFGGTSWGWLPASVVYTSYDYGVGIDETRQLRAKQYTLKQLGEFVQAATPLLAHVDKGPSLVATSANVKLYHDVGAGGEGHLIFALHNPSNGLTDDTFKFDLETKDGKYTLPQSGTLRLNGHDAKLLLADYPLAHQHLVYTTSDTQTHFSQGTGKAMRDVALLYGRPGEDGETTLRYASKPKVTILSGKASFVYAKSGDLRFNYTHSGLTEVMVTGGGKPPLLLLLADDATAQQFWRLETAKGTILARSQSLLRSATFASKEEPNRLSILGDVKDSEDGTVDVWFNQVISGIDVNGTDLGLRPGHQTVAMGDYRVTGQGMQKPEPVTVPDLMAQAWTRHADSPEAKVDFDDSAWRKADLATSTAIKSTQPPAGQPVLDMSQYGFHHGDVWYRGRFKVAAADKKSKAAIASNQAPNQIDVFYGGGGSGMLQLWVDGVFIGQSEVPSGKARPETTARVQFNLPALSAGDHVISVMVRNNSHNWDLAATDEHKEARGLISLSLSQAGGPAFSTPIDWKIQGNKGGEDIADIVRGPMNNGGLYGERLGWHLPSGGEIDFKTGWDTVKPTDPSPAPGTYWLRTDVPLDLPKGQDVQLGLQFGDPSKPQSKPVVRALIFVNGWNMGNFIASIGPQRTFILPPGILNANGNNTIALAVTSDGKPENALEPVKLVVLANVRGGVAVEPVAAPKNLQR